MSLTFFDCTPDKFFFFYFTAVSGSYLRPGRSKCHTVKAQNHLLDVARAGKQESLTLAKRAKIENFFWPSSSQRNGDFSGGATFMFSIFLGCTVGITAGLLSTFWFFSAVSGSYLRPGRLK